MVWCFVVYCVQLPVCWIFCLPLLFQSFCLSQSIPVMDFQYWCCKSRVSSWYWTSKSWYWNYWVLVLVLEKQVLNPSLVAGRLQMSVTWFWQYQHQSLILLLLYSGSSFVSSVNSTLASCCRARGSRASLFKNQSVPGMNAATAIKTAIMSVENWMRCFG